MKSIKLSLILAAAITAPFSIAYAQKGPVPMSFADASKSFLNTSKCKKSEQAKIDSVEVKNIGGRIFVNLITDDLNFAGVDTPLLGPLKSQPTDIELAGLKGKKTCFGY